MYRHRQRTYIDARKVWECNLCAMFVCVNNYGDGCAWLCVTDGVAFASVSSAVGVKLPSSLQLPAPMLSRRPGSWR